MGTTRKAKIADPAMAGDTYVEITQLVKQRKDDTDGHRPGIRTTSYINVCRFPTNERLLRSKGVSND